LAQGLERLRQLGPLPTSNTAKEKEKEKAKEKASGKGQESEPKVRPGHARLQEVRCALIII
jgi:hypothetical protein